MCTEDGHLGLLMIGGNDGAANKSVDLITKGECKENEFPQLPVGRIGGVAGVLSFLIIFCGGFDDMMQVSGDCWILRLGETQWSPGERLPQPTVYAAQVVANEKFYVVGGLYQRNYLNTVQVFDGQKWHTEAGLVTPRFGACAVSFKSYMIVIGGERESVTGETAVEMVSVGETNSEEYILWWRKMATMNGFVGSFTPNCVTTQDGVMVFGGINDHLESGPVMNSEAHNLMFDCDRQGYVCDYIIPGGGLTNAWHPGIGRVNCGILVAGGRGMGDTQMDTMIHKSTKFGQWRTVGSMSRSKDQSASVVLTHHWDLYATHCTVN